MNYSSGAYLDWPQIPSQKGILTYDSLKLTFTNLLGNVKFSLTNDQIAKIAVPTNVVATFDVYTKNGDKYRILLGDFEEIEKTLPSGTDIVEMRDELLVGNGRKQLIILINILKPLVVVDLPFLSKLNMLSATKIAVWSGIGATVSIGVFTAIGMLLPRFAGDFLPWIIFAIAFVGLSWLNILVRGLKKGLIDIGFFSIVLGLMYFFEIIVFNHRYDSFLWPEYLANYPKQI